MRSRLCAQISIACQVIGSAHPPGHTNGPTIEIWSVRIDLVQVVSVLRRVDYLGSVPSSCARVGEDARRCRAEELGRPRPQATIRRAARVPSW